MSWTSLHRASRLFAYTILEQLVNPSLMDISRRDLSEVQFTCLNYLMHHGPVAAKGVARALKITPAAATKLLDRLVRKGLVSREPDSLDRRRVVIGLTEIGRQSVNEVIAAEEVRFGAIVDAMSPEALKSLQAGLSAFLAAARMENANIRTACLRRSVNLRRDYPEQPKERSGAETEDAV